MRVILKVIYAHKWRHDMVYIYIIYIKQLMDVFRSGIVVLAQFLIIN